MKQVHLISMPWGVRHIPSTQIGVLKSYLKANLPEQYQVQAHHLHFSIPSEIFPDVLYKSVVARNFHEGYYLYLLMLRFGPQLPIRKDPHNLYQEIKKHVVEKTPGFVFLEEGFLLALMRSTNRALDNFVAGPAKDAEEIVIGMTTNFHQTYANIYAYFYLREKLPGKKLIFVFGGASVSYPHVLEILRQLGIDAYAIIGEGEMKLLKFIKHFSEGLPLEDKNDGIFHLNSAPDTFDWKESWYKSQIKSMAELPDPDYDEYFFALNKHIAVNPESEKMRKDTEIPIEGSRGCVFACEFCNLNRFWDGYRKLPGEEIADRALRLSENYQVSKIRFVDNLCDGWATQYAERLAAQGKKLTSTMEIRPKHDEKFWIKMAQSGLFECQIGVEGLDDDILLRVKKGTTSMDVVHNQKVLTENQILYGSRQIISYYPRSTPEEVIRTREVLEALIHMPKFDMSPFIMGIDSPIYRTLSPEERRSLTISTRFATSMPESLKDLNVFFPLEVPDHLRPSAPATEEWKKLIGWYESISPSHWSKNSLIIENDQIMDRRLSEAREYNLSPDEALVYSHSHAPISKSALQEKTGLSLAEIEKILDSFNERKLIFSRGGRIIALALRLTLEQINEMQKLKSTEIIR